MFGLDQRGPTYTYLKFRRELKIEPSSNNHIIDEMCFPFTENLSCHDMLFFTNFSEDKCAKCDVHAHCENGKCVCDGGYYGEGIRGECFRVGGMKAQQITNIRGAASLQKKLTNKRSDILFLFSFLDCVCFLFVLLFLHITTFSIGV